MIFDYVRQACASENSVSYVLNDKGSVSKEVSDQVRKAVKKLNYRPSRIAQSMGTGFTQSIGFMLPDLTNPFFPELAQMVENAARNSGVSVVLVDSQNRPEVEEEGLIQFQQHAVDGVILCPVVLIDRPLPRYDVVHSDYRKGGALLADYAIKLGHKKVELLSGPQTMASARQRREGFVKAAGDKIKVAWDEEVPFSLALTSKARKAIRSRKVSLIFSADDFIAIGAISEINEMELRVPEDISVMGFDNIPWSTVVRPKLTTIKQHIRAIGAEAVNLLSERINNPGKPTRAVVLDVDLTIRDSACRYPGSPAWPESGYFYARFEPVRTGIWRAYGPTVRTRQEKPRPPLLLQHRYRRHRRLPLPVDK